ncbi:YDG domain-containing protein, partial [Chromobacterium alticapitis]|uniref:YDG domain-containing protein n=1 Tax=Chromobacterium alticapitis TaxID=2073169 RepID=UPI0034E1DE9D
MPSGRISLQSAFAFPLIKDSVPVFKNAFLLVRVFWANSTSLTFIMHRHASHNRAYSLVWNEASQSWVPAPENSKARGKRSGMVAISAIAALLAATSAAHAAPNTLPGGGQVTLGQASINQSGNIATIRQSSDKAAIDWQSFSIGQDAKVNFLQPSSRAVMLNRVIGNDPSQIFGQLNANGQVFIVNPNGVLFAPGAQVSAAGILASTRDLSTADFAAGNYRFAGQSHGTVDNQGSLIAANGGYALLIGAQVSNSGSIQAPQGDVRLAAANEVTVKLDGSRLAGFTVTQGTLDALAANQGLIRADGGRVYLTAQALDQLTRAAVNNDGIIEANCVVGQNGRIALQGDLVSNTGSLSASAGSGDRAGAIDLAGGSVLQAGQIHADGEQGRITIQATQALLQTEAAIVTANGAGQGGIVRMDGGGSALLSGAVSAKGTIGGELRVTANKLTLSGARLSADGSAQGGSLLLGGDAHGASLADGGPGFANAQTTQVNTASTLSAAGANSKIVVWSDASTRYAGQASTGAHGFIEVSGKGDLLYQGSANPGQGGHLLLDPTNIVISKSAASATDYIELADPSPASNNNHGSGGAVLNNGNIVVASSSDSFGGAQAGAAYLYNGTTGALISTLFGTHANDQVGSGGVTTLSNGNYVVLSPNWTFGSNAKAGAVTWGSAGSGVTGSVSAANSLVGVQANDQVGLTGVIALSKGNYVVDSANWANGGNAKAGAVTWGNGASGVTGQVSAYNSLVGSHAMDQVGLQGITALSNGNYVVASPSWSNGSNASVGAVTWGNGLSGVQGLVSVTNSLVGSQANDQVGTTVTALTNGNYVVASADWSNGSNVNAGATTWGNGSSGLIGTVSPFNSLVGLHANDQVGAGGVTALSNGNYVVSSPYWTNGANANAGAVTWGDGSRSMVAAVSAGNSLVGSHANDYVGVEVYPNNSVNNGVTALTNGNYVVASPNWANGGVANAGAATWADGTRATAAAVSASNSLVGSKPNDQVGEWGVTALSNGNYVVVSPYWANGSLAKAGATTWGNGAAGTTGAVSTANSLVGLLAGDQIGSGSVTALGNGNYVVISNGWNSDINDAVSVGAVTWMDGSHAVAGVVSSSNSLVGSQTGDQVGQWGITVLSNGNYVVDSPYWSNGSNSQAGAVTWGSGSTNTVGVVSAANSLVGSQAKDQVGSSITALSNGNYVVGSANWANGGKARAGAVTWGDGTLGVAGAVSAGNSLVGAQANDQMSSGAVIALANGNYVVSSPYKSNNGLAAAGQVLLLNGSHQVQPQAAQAGSYTPDQVAALAPAGASTTLSASNNITVNDAVSVAGSLTLLAGNSITLNAGISSSASGTALVLAGKSFINRAGSSALSTPNGNWQVWSTDPGVDSRGGLAYDFKQYNANFGSSAVSGRGNGLFYSLAPQVTASLVGNIGKIYDGTARASVTGGNLSAVGAIDGDSVSLGAASASYDSANAGSSKTVTANGVAVVGANNGYATVYGYGLSTTTAAAAVGTIGKAIVNVSNVAVANKVYDGGIAATVTGGTLSGLFGSDTLTLASSGAQFSDKNVGVNKAVSVSGLTLADGTGLASNYQLANTTASGQASISAKQISVSASAVDKVYDGGTSVSAALSSAGLVSGDAVSFNGNAAFADKNVGNGKSVVVSGIASSGADAANYTLANTRASTQAAIRAKQISVSANGVNKVYDGGTTAQAAFSSTGVVRGDAVSFSGNAAFADKNVGNGKSVVVSGIASSGADAGNYTLASTTATTQANISAKQITVSASAANKMYDGSTAANAILSSDGVISGDAVGFSGNAAFADKNAGTGKTVNVSGIAGNGADAGNYTLLNSTASTQANIAAKQITVSASGVNKVYDGSTAASAKLASAGIVSGDDVSLSGTAAFADKNAGTGKTVNVSGIAGNGADAGNYTLLNSTAGTQANIT